MRKIFKLMILHTVRFIVIALLFAVSLGKLFAQNAIVAENSLTGTPASVWDISGAGDLSIQGFATDISVNKGETVHFKIKTDASNYTIDIYRIGYYQGNGARKVGTGVITASLPQTQPNDLYDPATGLTDCGNWNESAHWDVPANAVSGVYIARLTRSNGGASHIVFIVRDDASQSDLFFQTGDATWQAYNNYGGNSLYVGSTSYPGGHAAKVSYNRPFLTRNGGGGSGEPAQDWFFNAEYPMIRWLERNGYDVTYTTDVDADRRGNLILNHKVYMSVGHDEYWSAQQRTNVEAARNAGIHLGFFCGNGIYWKTRWEPSIDGTNTAYRTLVCYKEGTLGENACGGKCDPLTNVWTGLWRDGCSFTNADGCNPENALSGQISWDDNASAITVPDTYKNLRFWRNTSIASLGSGQTATLSANTLGYEWDWYQYPDTYPIGRITMSSTTIGSHTHNLSLYRHPSGALVFGAGTVQWSWGLDGVHDRGSSTPDVRIQQATVNLFADMGVQPGSLQSNLVAATASTDTQAPTTIITSPATNANIAVGSSVTIKGTASDNSVVAGVEISVDGGATWQQATGTTNWTYSWTPSNAGTVTIKTRGFDDIGNIEASGEGSSSNVVTVNVTATQTGCPCFIFQSTDVPANQKDNDGTPIELGVKFRSSVNGYITGLRFYKGLNTTGTHTGHLWTGNGTLLASATFKNETASGWQQVLFGTPVAVNANTTYVASFFSSSGDYASTLSFFTQDLINDPLKALADGEDGPNGVYVYATSSTFPTETYQSTNYYVDVVFNTTIGPDVTPPRIVSLNPGSQATGVKVTSSVVADFNESIDEITLNSSTFFLSDPSGNLISANISYNNASDEAILMPVAPLAYSTVYTVTLKGGATDPRIKDLAGNALAKDSTWSFTTTNPPPPLPNDGPGGPILIISSGANPFSRYPVEILRAEGLNEFAARDISAITSNVLDSFDVIILGELPLSPAMVTMLTNWTNAGGTLIALRPDAQLSTLLGISKTGSTLSDKYLSIAASGPGVGIVNQTIQYHGTADLYTMNGAISLATLYSSATASTNYPAVTARSVGSNGGMAVAFTYDLARSIVYTRQGNPAWAGQKRDGQIPPIRSDDLFYGNASFDPEPDWIDLNKVSIPQADEQQHLLTNIINNYNLHKNPLPRFWFLPNNFKAAIVMTGDDHGNGGTVGRFNQYLSLSSSNTTQSVLDWTAIRSTSYIYPGTPITNSQVSSFQSQGFEISLHLNTGCQDWTVASWNSDYDDQISQLEAQLPSLTPPITHRTHCIAWSDWASEPKMELSKGIRLDVNYYYWPGVWLQDRSGMFTGSGMPMRFADMDGSIIDCYQVTTQMPDESDETFPQFCDQLLDNATGTAGYYGVFCANMHTDNASSPGSDAIISSAQAHNVPIISAKQMLTWLDGRNNSSFKSISWNVNQLSFSIDTGVGSYHLQAMVPVNSSVGTLVGIKLNGATVTYATQTIKGVMYAFFAAKKGNYAVSYGTDNTPPSITNIVATPHADGTATITWKTNELSNSTVDYNADPNSLSLSSNDINLVLSHSIMLSGLTQGATYHFRVTSVDGASNSATSPVPPDSLSFIMPTTNCTLNATATAQGSILCNGGTTSIVVSATGGTLPYTGTGTFTAGSGTHNYTVTDKNGCSSTATITISEPASVVVTASPGIIACSGGSTSVVVTATGGTGAYTGTGTFNNVAAGTYTYSVTDENSCSGSTTITITQPAALTFGTPTITKASCGSSNGKIVISASGGTGSITYTISPNTGTQNPSGTFNNLPVGTYIITATDGNSCTKTSNSITVGSRTGTAPAKPGTISGPTFNICGSGTFTYSISAVMGATSYNWRVPAGLSIVSNTGTSIVVSNASSAFSTSGAISVAAANSCGTSAARTLTIFAVAPNPTTISGLTSVSANQTGVRYSVTNRAGITFNWSVPPGTIINSGQGTNAIKVKFGTTSGNVSVYLSNACGKTATASLFVTVASALVAQSQPAQATTAENSYIKVYPNPANSIATVVFNSKKEMKYEIVVTDIVGKTIIRKPGIAIGGENTLQLSMGKYAAGTYFVSLITAEGTKTVKLNKE